MKFNFKIDVWGIYVKNILEFIENEICVLFVIIGIWVWFMMIFLLSFFNIVKEI